MTEGGIGFLAFKESDDMTDMVTVRKMTCKCEDIRKDFRKISSEGLLCHLDLMHLGNKVADLQL